MSPLQHELEALHVRFVSGDWKAGGDICDRLFACLVRRLSRGRHPVRDEHVYIDAVSKALHGYVREPAKFRPHKAPLDAYLLIRARGHLSDSLRKARRRARNEKNFKKHFGNGHRETYLYTDRENDDLIDALDGFIEQLNPVERAFVARHRADVHDTEEYFKVLLEADPSLAGAAKERRQQLVANYWDRLLKKLQRMADRS